MKILAMLLAVAGTVLPAAALADTGLSDSEIRRLMDNYKTLRGQADIQAKEIGELREQVIRYQREQELLREELSRRGVDVEQLLAPPATSQADAAAPGLVFESPESMTEYIRENFSQRIRPEMTRLQRYRAEKEFNSWLNSAALLPTQVTWVFRVDDAWRADSPEQVDLTYFSDREPLVTKLTGLNRTLDEFEMLELNLARLKAEQKARREIHEQRVRELGQASATQKPLAERVMRQAYERVVEINVQVRTAEGQLAASKLKRPRTTTQPQVDGYRLMIRGRGGRDRTIELNVFCHERDTNRLMSAPKDSLIKIRGWVSDMALAPRVATIGIRLDHAEVLVTNVETPPPPPAENAGQANPAPHGD